MVTTPAKVNGYIAIKDCELVERSVFKTKEEVIEAIKGDIDCNGYDACDYEIFAVGQRYSAESTISIELTPECA